MKDRVWKTAFENYPEDMNPADNGWRLDGEVLVPLWCEAEELPGDLVELLEDCNENCVEDNESCQAEDDSDDSELDF